MADKRVVIIVAGCSASGKTTFCNMLTKKLKTSGVSSTVISADSFYRNPEEGEDPATRDYDHPKAFDEDLMVECIETLKSDKMFHVPVYDYATHCRRENRYEVVFPRQVIILEGILTLHSKRLRDMADRTVYIHTPLDECFIRRLRRDIKERGRTVDSVIEQYYRHVRPSYINYVEPSGDYADYTVNNVTKSADDMFETGECRGLIDYIEKETKKQIE